MYNRLPLKGRGAGFTMLEIIFAATIMAMAGVAFVSVMNFSGYAMFDITQQTAFNNSASNTTLQIIQRTRYSHTVEVSNSGNTLTLSFDDNYKKDEDGDGNFYNDTDYQETFEYATTAADGSGTISHQSTADADPHTLLTDALPIGSSAIFEVNGDNRRQIDIQFRLHNKLANNGRTQKIDISTSAYCLNYQDGT
jgi:type II secretory pathway pseudopilin PulG